MAVRNGASKSHEMKKPYQQYQTEDFATDPGFRNWVLSPSEEDEAIWQDFLVDHPDKGAAMEEARLLILGTKTAFDRSPVSYDERSQYFEEVKDKAQHPSPIVSAPPAPLRRITRRRWAVAAVILCLLGIGGWWLALPPSETVTYATTYGEWKTVSLPDGSEVKLNANSRITLERSWKAGATRKVWLEGEAFFKVEKQPATQAKFVVMTDGVCVEVLGTSFNVNSRGPITEVFLEEGKIKWKAGEQEQTMEPGDLLTYSREKRAITLQKKAAEETHISWKDGALILKDTPNRDILARIEDLYGIQFEVAREELLDKQTTLRVPMDKLEITLPILEKALGAKIIQNKDHYLIQ